VIASTFLPQRIRKGRARRARETASSTAGTSQAH
jgi:hypothetical protein